MCGGRCVCACGRHSKDIYERYNDAAQKTLGMGRMSVTVECILNEHLQMVLRIPAHERSITLMLAHANTLYEKLKREDKNARHLTRRRTKGNKVTMAAVLARHKTTAVTLQLAAPRVIIPEDLSDPS